MVRESSTQRPPPPTVTQTTLCGSYRSTVLAVSAVRGSIEGSGYGRQGLAASPDREPWCKSRQSTDSQLHSYLVQSKDVGRPTPRGR
jgi:hypothetical protein